VSVWVRQLVDDLETGDYIIAPVDVADTDVDLLNRKAASHTAYGWTVVWLIPDVRFKATKIYDGMIRLRIFEIR